MLPDHLERIARIQSDTKKRTERLERMGSGANRLIDSAVLAAPAATVTFANIPNIYDHLIILDYTRSSLAAPNENLAVRFNVDAGNNYDWFQAVISTGGVGLFSAVAANLISVHGIEATLAPANTFATGMIRINNYANTANHKSCIGGSSMKIANVAASIFRIISSGTWRNVAAISSITLLTDLAANLVAGSRFDLYGIQGGP